MIASLPPALIWSSATLPLAWIILGILTVQRGLELLYAAHNTRRLVADGATESGKGHYPFMVAIHAGFLIALWWATPPYSDIIWPLAIAFLTLQIARFWVLATLGRFWTTRIISSPSFPRIKRGPYRITRHPNYWIVTLEIVSIPLIFGHLWLAIVFSILNALILAVRISIEEKILQTRHGKM